MFSSTMHLCFFAWKFILVRGEYKEALRLSRVSFGLGLLTALSA